MSSGEKRRLENLMYAVIRTGGRQYRVEVGDIIDVEKLPFEVDDQIIVEDVLLIGDGDATVIGQPKVDGATVNVKVLAQFRGPKIIVYKYRQRTTYRRTRGHRQYYTRLHIDSINI